MVLLDPHVRSGGRQFDLQRVDESTWIIRDAGISASDARSVVACVTETPFDEVDVLWLRPLGLPTHYRSAQAVVSDLTRHGRRSSGTTRPVPIPHFPPVHPERC